MPKVKKVPSCQTFAQNTKWTSDSFRATTSEQGNAVVFGTCTTLPGCNGDPPGFVTMKESYRSPKTQWTNQGDEDSCSGLLIHSFLRMMVSQQMNTEHRQIQTAVETPISEGAQN